MSNAIALIVQGFIDLPQLNTIDECNLPTSPACRFDTRHL
jgi:hypothetical protein